MFKNIVKVCAYAFVTCMCASQIAFSQVTFAKGTGEVAIVEYFSLPSTTPPISIHFSFISFVDITVGTELKFTDDSYNRKSGADAFVGGEGILTWAAAAAITKGTVITINGDGSGNWSTNTALGTLSESGDFKLNDASGDQIFIYQGAKTKANLIAGICVATSWVTTGNANESNSYLPSTLANGVASLQIANNKNAQFNFKTSSNEFVDLRSQLFDKDFWNYSNTPSDLDQNLTVETFGIGRRAPGGVTQNLEFWLKGNAGFTDASKNKLSVTRSGNVNNTSDTKNYNPTITFDGDGDYITTGLTLNPSTNNFSTYTVFNSNGSIGSQSVYQQLNGAGVGRTILYLVNEGANSFFGGTQRTFANTYSDSVYTSICQTYNFTTRNFSLYEKGDLDSTIANVTAESANGAWVLGANKFLTNNYFDGSIAESIVYSKELSSVERERIESYLAMKYSLPIQGDLYTSKGVKFWTNPGLTDIVVIGRDFGSDFYQKQSMSKGDSIRLFIDDLAASNAANVGTISRDTSFIVLSSTNVNAPIDGDTTSSRMPAGMYSMFNQTWQITNYNFDDEFSIEIEWDSTGDFDIDDIRMVIDTDADLSDGTIIDNSYGVTFSIGSIIISGISTAVLPKNSSAFFTIGSVAAATPLPIDLLSFTADYEDTKTNIHWETTSEIDNDYFTLEKSSDGKRWEVFGIIAGAGTSNELLGYDFVDAHPFSSTTYYRLKQTDFDGTYVYSKIIVVGRNMSGNRAVLYPNPNSGDNIYLNINNLDKVANIEVFDILGQTVPSYEIIKQSEQNIVKVKFKDKLAAGQFIVKIDFEDDGNHIIKFVTF